MSEINHAMNPTKLFGSRKFKYFDDRGCPITKRTIAVVADRAPRPPEPLTVRQRALQDSMRAPAKERKTLTVSPTVRARPTISNTTTTHGVGPQYHAGSLRPFTSNRSGFWIADTKARLRALRAEWSTLGR